VRYIIPVEVVCFDTPLQVLILEELNRNGKMENPKWKMGRGERRVASTQRARCEQRIGKKGKSEGSAPNSWEMVAQK